MKRIAIAILALIIMNQTGLAQAPNSREWLRQKKTQRRYLIEQIAALQAYLGVVKKGYNIVDEGLTSIGNIKGDTHGMDKAYFASLRQVSPVITNSPKYQETKKFHQTILRDLLALSKDAQQDTNFSANERAYVTQVYRKMQSDCNATMEAFLLAVSSDVAEMQDADRLAQLDKAHTEMKDRLGFTKHFVSSTRTLSAQRAKEKLSIEVMRKLNGNN